MALDQEPLPLNYATPVAPKKQRLLLITLSIAAVLVAGFIVLQIFTPSLNSRGSSPRAKCASNMHQIGLAILLYQGDHGQVYPNSLEELMEEHITTAVFTCPTSMDTPSAGATTQQVGADFRSGGHLSYVYLGKGLTDKSVTDDMVILYEPLANHGNTGMNVLFGDGHAEWVDATLGKKIIAAANAGVRVKVNATAGVATAVPITATQP